MTKFVWSIDPLAVSRLRDDSPQSPLSASELACLGIPKRKIPRVEAELARLCAETEVDHAALAALARQIARQFL